MILEIKIEPKNTNARIFNELYHYRELLFYFSWRDIKVKYKETALGVIWVMLQPIVMTLLFVLIFSRGLRVAPESGLPYPVFLLSGFVLWNFAASCMNNAASSMELNAKIIKKVYFPRLIVPLSAVLTAAFDLLFGLVLLGLACLFYGVSIYFPKILIVLPLGLALMGVAAMGLACLFAMLNAIFKDFRYIIPFAVQVLFFSSPVFYDMSSLGENSWVEILSWNPFAGGIQVFRAMFSEESLSWIMVAKSSVSALACFFVGLFIFKKLEPKLADLI